MSIGKVMNDISKCVFMKKETKINAEQSLNL